MDLDLSQEPLDSSHGSVFRLGSLLDELGTAHGCIEERIRQLEAVTSRARQRQRWRQNDTIPYTVNIPGESTTTEACSNTTGVGFVTQEMTLGARNFVKRSDTHLIAKALGADNPGFFDCNICLDIAREPILTHCGHLFCWPCFYQVSYVHSNVKECPRCMAEITDTSVIPIYGQGNDARTQKSRLKESGLKVPPRPHAHRIESRRQQISYHRAISSMIDQNIRPYNMIVATEDQSGNFDGTPSMTERAGSLGNQSINSQPLPAMQTDDSQHHHSSQVSRQQPAPAFNSAMDSVERSIDNLEASIQSRHMRRHYQLSLSDVDRHSFPSIAASVQQNRQILDNAGDMDLILAHNSSSVSTDGITAIENSSIMPIRSSFSRRRALLSRISEVENSIQENSTSPHSASTPRRRSEFSGVADIDNGSYREPRRRRLM